MRHLSTVKMEVLSGISLIALMLIYNVCVYAQQSQSIVREMSCALRLRQNKHRTGQNI